MISVPAALLLYVCNFVSWVSITFRVGQNSLWPKKRGLRLNMARGQQKIQSQQKAAEKAAKLKKAVRQWIIVCDAKATVLQCKNCT